jgi:branched-subunit amino acid ABC-type transport system permease component
MNAALLFEQMLNGLQLGVQLFLMSAGLTLVFGIMNLINLAHGSLYMMGAFLAATLLTLTGSFALALRSRSRPPQSWAACWRSRSSGASMAAAISTKCSSPSG